MTDRQLFYSDEELRHILKAARTIAIVGASANNARPSYNVMEYLMRRGYRIFPINPGHAGGTILGVPVYGCLADVPDTIDVVDIFRRNEAVPAVVDDVLALQQRPDCIWMQLGVRSDDAARRAEAAGLFVVMDRCSKIEHARLIA